MFPKPEQAPKKKIRDTQNMHKHKNIRNYGPRFLLLSFFGCLSALRMSCVFLVFLVPVQVSGMRCSQKLHKHLKKYKPRDAQDAHRNKKQNKKKSDLLRKPAQARKNPKINTKKNDGPRLPRPPRLPRLPRPKAGC